ncbi:hypothetical protein M404DRAFT_677760 [Pisolithus tinctorius Marx 270]|uniref:Uncharacterized protein n=1 Tax=Pisolithus tinctorius Marx 270 TaxID=870435 RepID=A0A0C3PF20_PISTI|nr:hypothetical protein M404DRAFT_677760 [Pisolithus tinctorius Marx 270]
MASQVGYLGPPTYISARSADVILSDVRPTRLADDALHATNALLDELLYNILDAARALNTAQLRAGLHRILPTTLGKEAVLEAELELRAYWDRTSGTSGNGSSQVVPDDGSFNLPWVFELLRLKCEAYSTLSDTDEDPDAEVRLTERMNAEGTSIPKQSLLAPASLYLTAIIESICEHVLSNVSRVVARDSSRATANSQDLFVALCEDNTIYGLFKNMKIYEEIESLSKLPNGRRSLSKSFSRERLTGAASPTSESFRKHDPRSSPRQRMSSESSGIPPSIIVNANHQSSRSSFDKSRGIKIFNNKGSPHASEHGHQKSESFASANAKQSIRSSTDKSPVSTTFSDTRSQEFDDMMRSGSTVRVSLTPDRLRTMEVLNKERSRPPGRQKGLTKTDRASVSESLSAPPSARSTRSPLQPVESIIEDDEDAMALNPPPTSRPRQLSAAGAAAASYRPTSFMRIRSASTSDSSVAQPLAASSKQTQPSESTVLPTPPSSAAESVPRPKAPPKELNMNAVKAPVRRPGRNRESLDLDDVMGYSDEETPVSPGRKISRPQEKHKGISTNTRDLIDFLAEGPPEPLATPSPSNDSFLSLTPKKSGRLQKMISRITLSGSSQSSKSSRKGSIQEVVVPHNKSSSNLSPLANRPIPPRYPTPGPSSAASSDRSSEDRETPNARRRSQSASRKVIPRENGTAASKEQLPVPPIPIIVPGEELCHSPAAVSERLSDSALDNDVKPPPHQSSSTPGWVGSVAPTSPVPSSAPASLAPSLPSSPMQMEFAPRAHVPPRVSSKSTKVAVAPPQSSSPAPVIPVSLAEQTRDMRRALAHAMNADECRLLVDMFLVRSKLVSDPAELRALATAPPPDPATRELNTMIERTLVGLFLGDSDGSVEYDTRTKAPTSFSNGHAEL